MRSFEWVAVDAAGGVVRGRRSAPSELALDRELEARGLFPTRLSEVGVRADARAHLSRAELLRLLSQLATLAGGGVPVAEGLRGIADRAPGRREGELVRAVVARLEAGEPLSDALAAFPRAFPPEVLAAVRAGESAGALPAALERAARHVEWTRAVRATAMQALVYPAILLAAIAALVAVLFTHVVPRVAALHPGGAADLPAETRALLAVSGALRSHGAWLAAALAVAVGAAAVLLRDPRGRRIGHRALLGLPVLGPLAARIATSRLAATAATLVAAGCDALTVLGSAGRASGNAALAAACDRAAGRVRAGSSIADGLAAEPLVDPLLVQMVGTGERSGRLGESLDRLAAFYDEEVPRAVKRTLSILEPCVLLAAGGVVAFVLLAAMLPVFDAYEVLG